MYNSPLSKDTKINEIVPFNSLAERETIVNTTIKEIEHKFKSPSRYILVSPLSFVGLEIEVENILDIDDLSPLCKGNLWNVTTDGSLREYGYEFISPPIRGNNIYYALKILEKDIKESQSHVKFSDRTSVHIHMDARQMTLENLLCFLLTYITVEKLLYMFVEKEKKKDENKKLVLNSDISDRYDNIFCSPIEPSLYALNVSYILELWRGGSYTSMWKWIISKWHKYGGINLLPLKKLGSIEFRQCHGTIDVQFIISWINLILCLKRFSRRTTVSELIEVIKNINTNSGYSYYLDDIFGRFSPLLQTFESSSFIESGVISVKTALVENYHESISIQIHKLGKNPLEGVKNMSIYNYLQKNNVELVKRSIDPGIKYRKTKDTSL